MQPFIRFSPVPARAVLLGVVLLGLLAGGRVAADPLRGWMAAWPNTDFSRYVVLLEEIRSGGPFRDDIPAIDSPHFAAIADAAVPAVEPVVSVAVEGDARAYPLRMLIWHEIVNDEVGGRPVAVTFSPLCNKAAAYDRRLDGKVLEFGTTGLLRHSNLVMYDRQSESWWQQYDGRSIVGKRAGAALQPLPARLEAMGRFAERHPEGRVLVPSNPDLRPYGRNPYTGYDSMPTSFLHDGRPSEDIPAMARVVVVGDRAWSLSLLRKQRRLEPGDLLIEWAPGQSSALDTKHIAEGRDIGNVVVYRREGGGVAEIRYSVEFAFAFKAFHPEGVIVTE